MLQLIKEKMNEKNEQKTGWIIHPQIHVVPFMYYILKVNSTFCNKSSQLNPMQLNSK